jgi:mono/diheme cytochrome c family protein
VSIGGLYAEFETETTLVAAARAVDDAGFDLGDAYAPYPIGDMHRWADSRRSGIPRAGLIGGILGAAGGAVLQVWTSAVSWPLDVGGKPALSWLAFVPVAFEMTMLGASAAVVLAFLLEAELRFRHRPAKLPGTTAGTGFALEIRAVGNTDFEVISSLLCEAGAVAIVAVPCDGTSSGSTAGGMTSYRVLNRFLMAAACLLVGLAILLWSDRTRRNLVFAPDMALSSAATTYSPNAIYADRQIPRSPVPGTVPRGPLPLRYEATEEDALRAGTELFLPVDIAAETDPTRGAALFATFCQTCHGSEGHGDGITLKRGFQPPPSLLTQHARDMKDGQMFHVLTYGQKLMPSHALQVAPEDRWRLIMHLRNLQRRLPVDPPPFGSPAAPATTKP